MCWTQLGEQSVPDKQNEQELVFPQFAVNKQVAYNSNSHTVSPVTINTVKLLLVVALLCHCKINTCNELMVSY